MLNRFRIWPRIGEQIQSGPLASHVNAYLLTLERGGYSKNGIRVHIRGIAAFSAWLSRDATTVEEIDQATLERYIASVGRTPSTRSVRGRLPAVASCARRFCQFLWSEGLVDRGDSVHFGDASGAVQSFGEHLRCAKGLAPGTVRIYLRYARSFLNWRFGTSEAEWSAVGPGDIVGFVRVQACRLKPSAKRGPVTAMRTFLRFLAFEGKVPAGLVSAVPTIRQWKHSSLPAS